MNGQHEMKIDHERCSELLASFVQGELDPSEAEAVARHLDGCPDCRAERRVLEELLAKPAEPMTGEERTRLRAAVAGSLSGAREARPGADVIPVRRRPWGARLAPVLGAAAAVALLAVGAWWAADTFGGDEGQESFARGGEAADAATEALRAGGPEPVFGGETGADAFTTLAPAAGEVRNQDQEQEALGEAKRAAPKPDAPLRAARKFFAPYARAYRPEQAGELQSGFVDLLASQADGGEEASLVKECAGQVVAGQTGPVLPVYGGYRQFKRTDVLVLGFVWAAGGSTEFNRFMYWAWPRTSCDSPVLNRTGTLEPP